MPQIRDSYEAETTAVVLYKTNLYSGSHNDITNTERFSDDIDLTMFTGAEIDFKFTGNNATDDLILTIYKRNDSTWTGNELAWKSALTVENDGTETEYHYTIPEAYQSGHYRWGIKSNGATTTFDIVASMLRWRKTNTRA